MRTEFSETVVAPIGQGGAFIPVSGMATTVYNANADGTDGSQAACFDNFTDGTQGTKVTDSSGKVSYYLDTGNYNIHFDDPQNPPRIESFVRRFSSVSLISAADIVSMSIQLGNIQTDSWTTYATYVPDQAALASSSFVAIDTIGGVDVPTDAMVAIWYNAIWLETLSGAAQAAIFIGNNQLQVPSSGGPVVQSAKHPGGSSPNSIWTPLCSFPGGLATSVNAAGTAYSGDVSSGQAVAIADANQAVTYALGGSIQTGNFNEGGPCWIWIPSAGAYDFSIRGLISSGSGAVYNRYFRLAVIPF